MYRIKKLLWICCILAASAVVADVSVVFSNTTLAQSTTNELGTVTLIFSADGSGNVSLNASTTSGEQIVQDAVADWNGPVGSISHSGAFNTIFSLVLNDVGGSGLKLTNNNGGGLGVGGQNAWRVDRPGIESILVSAAIPVGKMQFNTVSWNHRSNSTVDMLLSSPEGALTNNLGSLAGSWSIAGDQVSVFSGQQIEFGNVDLGPVNDGYALAGFSFDITDGVAAPEIVDLIPDSQTSYTTQSYDGRTVWVSDNFDGQLYFDVPGSFGFVPGQPVYVRIEYHDTGLGRLFVEYDSASSNYEDSETHSRSSRVGQEGFVYSYQQFKAPQFAGGQNGGNDFRFKLKNTDGTPLRIASVQISTAPYNDEMFQLALSEPWLEPYGGEIHDFVDNQTLAGKVMTGYQGWFRTPNDVLDNGWNHWGGGKDANGDSRGSSPSAKWMTVDAWPYVDDYEAESLVRAGDMFHLDGRPAYLFSSQDPAVVDRHFRWMRKHGIDGAYLQYFVQANRSGANGAKKFVLNNVMEAASKEGRIWALEYDISGLSTNFNTAMNTMTNDWNWMVNEAGITEDPRYAHEDGKPVLFIWGFGVRDHSVELSDAVLDWFAQQDLYLICGTRWKDDAAWQNHFKKYDQLLIWMERDLNDLIDRKADLESWGMKILPHVWPGFTWHNLKMYDYPQSYTARGGGQFYWDRIYNAVAVGADQIFLGMFDEYDEGTQIMPMADNHPDIHTEWGHYIDNEGLDPFWYLQLSEAAREMLNGRRALSATMPLAGEITPSAFGGEDASCYLGTNTVDAGVAHTQPPDGITDGLFIDGQHSRTNAGSYFYFSIDDAFAYAVAEGQAATIEMEYYDDAAGTTLRLQYDSVSSVYKTDAQVVVTPGYGGWKRARWNVEDGFFGNRQNGMSDFRINVTEGNVAAIRRVSVFLPEETGGVGADAPYIDVVDGLMEWPILSDSTGWRLAEAANLASNDWNEIAGPFVFTNDVVQYGASTTNSAGFYRLQRPAKK